MNLIRNFYWTTASVIAMILPTTLYAADPRYPINIIQKIEIIEPSGSSAWEDKNWLDCDDVVLTEEDVRYALQHMRRISRKHYFGEYMERTGCAGGASVTFKNGKTIVIGVEPTGRINIFETDKKLKPLATPESFYDCEPCSERKMGLLQDALDRATERRIKELKKQGRIPP